MARRKTVPELLAEAFLAKQEAKVAQAKADQGSVARPTGAQRPPRTRRPDPAAKHARLLAAGEKILAQQDAAKAKEVARVEADLANRQAARERESRQRQRDRVRTERSSSDSNAKRSGGS